MNIDIFNELSWNEKLNYYRSNSDLQEAGFDKALDDACFWIGEYLDQLPSVSGYIGDRGEHISISDENMYNMQFEYELRKLQGSMPLLSDKKFDSVCNLLEEWYKLGEEAENIAPYEDVTNVYGRMDNTKEAIEDILFYTLKQMYEDAFNDTYQLEVLMNDDDFGLLLDDSEPDGSANIIRRLMKHGISRNTAINIYNDFDLAL